MNDIKNTIIEARDFYGENCLADKIGNISDGKPRRPLGEVAIYEEVAGCRKKLIHKENLVTYTGREMLAQRLVNIANTFFTSGYPSKDEYITWFGLGEGGVRPADPLDPVSPINNDEYLYSPIPVSDSTGSIYADYHTSGSVFPGGGTYSYTGSYVKSFDGVVFEADVLNDSKQLVLQITTTIGANEAHGYQLSEAGLFSAESNVGGYSGNFTMFSRVSFPSLIKTAERRLIFIWYLFV